MVMLAVDSTARPFECDIGEKPNILAGYRETSPRAMRGRPVTARGVCKMSMNAETRLASACPRAVQHDQKAPGTRQIAASALPASLSGHAPCNIGSSRD
ncbi:hypothetical protein [Paraburkholderia strydomiana]|uniref:hypothetical protein n=1 Tax=Paraburkholderia strydomiana TaxID=1245417 RepID=UPI0028679F70|nr:hypothetical protein [Paraburkholderia strydomiana]MDR7008151.1 hypothetical protein [Paraburkholderia strydomiana]